MAIGSKSTCTIGLYGAMPVWLENDAPNTRSASASFITHDATGVPLRPSTPQPSGWWSETWPLALNVVSTGARSRLGELHHGVHVEPGAVADDDHRAAGPGSSTATASTVALAGGGTSVRPPGRPDRRRGHLRAGWTCTSSGSTRWPTPRSTTACLSARVISSAWSDPGSSVREKPATSENAPARSRSWNAPRPSTLDGTCPQMASTGARSTLAS